jgi:glycosyltransferase involved in cell wall biosynthesis
MSSHIAKLVQLHKDSDTLTRSLGWRSARCFAHLRRAIGRSLRGPFVRIAFHKNGRPRGWLRPLTGHSDPGRSRQPIPDLSRQEESIPAEDRPDAILDARKKTILVISHEATRSGAPILALNLIQQLSARYNVISLLLGGGELTDDFRLASASLYVAERSQMSDGQLGSVIEDIATRFPLTFAIANTVESRRALGLLKERGVPTVSLIHEFSSYIRPLSVFIDVITQSTDTVFSTKVTLESAIRDIWLYPSTSIHVAAQGRCNVPATSRTGSSNTQIEKLWSTRNSLPTGKRKFLVIGVGTVELRKGVDLFISCAATVRHQKGGERYQFLWIGRGFDPDTDSSYSVFLADQIKRAGIESCIDIMLPTSQIEIAYQTANLLLIPSRLDPLPNVAIEAMTVGLPVVCFERTTGIADFLIESGLGDQCVARYLDTHDLARKVKALADSDDLRARVSERSREAAKKQFNMNAYVSKVEGIAIEAAGRGSRIREEVKTILASGLFRRDFFVPPTSESIPEEALVETYVQCMASGLAIRKPMPGFQPTVYDWLKTSEVRAIGDPFADFLREGLPEGPWLQKVIQSGTQPRAAPKEKPRTALHLHAYYPDQLTGIMNRLGLNACAPDLFISVPSPDAATEALRAVSAYRGRVLELQITPNSGRDIGPLLTQFGKALCADYDIIGHLHTKKSAHADLSIVEAWRTFLLENLIGGERGGAMLDAILYAMALDPAIGIVFPDDPNVMSWTNNRGHAEEVAARMKCGTLPEHFNFPIGSMFWMRSSILSRFVELQFAWSDYPDEPLRADGTVVHAIERLFGVLPPTIGMSCAVTNVRGVTR